MKPYEATPSDLIDMGIHGLEELVKELQGKWPGMSHEQRREFRAIGMSILTDESHERAA